MITLISVAQIVEHLGVYGRQPIYVSVSFSFSLAIPLSLK